MASCTEYHRTRLGELLNIFADVPISSWGNNPYMWELIQLVKNGTVTLDMVYRIYVEVASTPYGDQLIDYLCQHPLTIHYLQQIVSLSDDLIPAHHKGSCQVALDNMHDKSTCSTLEACGRCPHPAGYCGWSKCPKS